MRRETERGAADAASRTNAGDLEFQPIAPLGSWELDVRAEELHGSDIFFHIFDLPPGTATLPFGKLMDVIPAADRERVNKTLKCAVDTHEPFDLEHRVVHRDGTVRVVRSRGQVVTDLGARSPRLVGTTLDITEPRLGHEGIRQSEERFRCLVANIPDVVWTSDATGNPIFVSPNCERAYGYTPDETCKPGFFFSRIHPDDYARVASAHHAFVKGDGTFDEEFRVQRKDSHWIWVRDQAVVSYEKHGKRYTDGVIADITARKQAEEQLRRSEAYLAESQKLSHTGNWVWSVTKQEIVFWSDEHYRIFGLVPRKGTVPFHEAIERIHPKDLTLFHRVINESLIKNKDFEADLRIVLPDGSLRNIHSIGHPVVDAAGVLAEFVGVCMDVTERKEREEELRLT